MTIEKDASEPPIIAYGSTYRSLIRRPIWRRHPIICTLSAIALTAFFLYVGRTILKRIADWEIGQMMDHFMQ